ncbi:hypothetical protein ABZ960_20280 [Streptomyces pseudovenezuelae]|uniref:hypothetical protein n=1 Tax=Streptomyces pseudovenezuelae TaxID=67350 RepID=UPI0034A35E10
MADETTEAEQAPKKGGRKPDPMTQLLNEVKAKIKNLAELTVKENPAGRAQQHERRASAWGRHYAQHSTLDGLILSLGFESLAALNPAERRYSLVQLAAAALVAVEKLEDGK